jgi:AcrR family transcriptional regulator
MKKINTYHHGDLPRQLLTHAASMAAEAGPESVTMRELARRVGVSHSAPVHHFGTRQNLLASLAAEGFKSLNEALAVHPHDIYAMGVAYVLWALEHPGHYAVMWQPRHLVQDHKDLNRERQQAWTLLSTAVATDDSPVAEKDIDAYAAFSIVHGLAGIWLSGVLPIPEEPERVAREVTRRFQFHPDVPAT